jgi:Big-like domain-containing protein
MGARSIRAILLAALVLLAAGAARASAATPRPPALRLVAVSPKGAAPGDATIALRFSAPLAPVTARSEPKLSPASAGAWSQPSPTTLSFTPSGAYLPGTVVRVTVPKALSSTDGASLRRAVTVTFQVQGGSDVRLAQLLAELRYLREAGLVVAENLLGVAFVEDGKLGSALGDPANLLQPLLVRHGSANAVQALTYRDRHRSRNSLSGLSSELACEAVRLLVFDAQSHGPGRMTPDFFLAAGTSTRATSGTRSPARCVSRDVGRVLESACVRSRSKIRT